MEETYPPPPKIPLGRRLRRIGRFLWLGIEHVFDLLVDALGSYARIIRREGELFLGVGLVLLGLLNFQNGKNCDGNAADYLSCTRPSTFYYYSWVEITLILIGAFLLILWYLKMRERATAGRK